MNTHIVPEFTLTVAIAAIAIAFAFILSFSLIKEPVRQKVSALLIAGAGAVYWSGGLGVWKFAFGSVMLFIAYKGLTNYYFISIGWLLHTGWDILHHLYGNSIVPMNASSSLGCAICDPIIALWYFFNAPTIFYLFRKTTNIKIS